MRCLSLLALWVCLYLPGLATAQDDKGMSNAGNQPSPSPPSHDFMNTVSSKKISGAVKTLGSAINAKVYLVQSGEGETKQPLCRDAIAKRVGKLGGMTVEVTGDWRGDVAKGGCFVGSDFRIVKNASGRAPMVGVLSRLDGGWRLKNDANLDNPLADVPPGLAKLEGKLVIVDVKPIDVPGSKERAWRVVTYAEFP